MAEHRWSLLCHRGCIDKYSNMLSLLDVTEEITIEELPESLPENAALPVSLQLVTMWHRSSSNQPERIKVTFTIALPGGEQVNTNSHLVGDLEESKRTRLIFGIQAIPFCGAGIYAFHVLVSTSQDDTFELVERVPLEIKIKEGAGAAPGSPEPPGEAAPSAPQESSSRPGPSHPSRRRALPKPPRKGSS